MFFISIFQERNECFQKCQRCQLKNKKMPRKLVRTASRIDVCRLTNWDKRVVDDQQGAKDIHRVSIPIFVCQRIRRGINSSTRNANTKVEINWTTLQDRIIFLAAGHVCIEKVERHWRSLYVRPFPTKSQWKLKEEVISATYLHF